MPLHLLFVFGKRIIKIMVYDGIGKIDQFTPIFPSGNDPVSQLKTFKSSCFLQFRIKAACLDKDISFKR